VTIRKPEQAAYALHSRSYGPDNDISSITAR
jgi:hypothetical protein